MLVSTTLEEMKQEARRQAVEQVLVLVRVQTSLLVSQCCAGLSAAPPLGFWLTRPQPPAVLVVHAASK